MEITPASERKSPYDIRPDTVWFLGATLLIAVAVGMFGSEGLVQNRAMALSLVALAAVSWAAGAWNDMVGRCALVTGSWLLVWLAAGWYGANMLILQSIPIAMATVLIGLPTGAVVAVTSISAMVGLQPLEPWRLTTSAYTIALLVHSGSFGLSLLLLRQMRDTSRWSWNTYGESRAVLDQVHQRQASIATTIDDLAHANRQLALANENLAAARRVAEEAQRTKSAFVSKVSHEFRTPLNMIIGLTELMIQTPETYSAMLPPGLLQDLDIVNRNCQHLASLVNDVLDLSQVEAGSMALQREDVDLGALIDEAVSAVRPLLDKKGLTCQVQTAANMGVYCDATRIRQVVLNLLSNAARFTAVGGIYVTATRDRGHIQVSIRDTGPGISGDDADRIFEPFYQAALNGRRPQDGTGLGLAISRQFVEQHGGRLWLESEPGEGSTFFFRLPLQDTPAVSAPAHRWISESWRWLQRQNRPEITLADVTPRIVLLDQTSELSGLVSRYAADTEYVPADGIDQAADELRLGESQGALVNTATPQDLWPLVSALSERAADLPVIGCAFGASREYALEAGAMGYLIKPVRRDDLDTLLDSIDGPLERILIVDDDADARNLMQRMVALYDSDIEVMQASSGERALEVLSVERPDLMLLDILMDRMDGWQVLEKKKELEEAKVSPETPVIIVSAQDPRDQPLASPLVMVATGRGLSLQRVLQYSDRLTHLMLEPEGRRAPEPPETPPGEPA